MVTYDRLPMRDVLVNRLGWTEEDAYAFLEALAAPTEHLATKDDIAALRGEIAAVRDELNILRDEVRAEIAAVRTEFKAELGTAVEQLKEYLNERLATLEQLRKERDHGMGLELRAALRSFELRMDLYIAGMGVAIIGVIIART